MKTRALAALAAILLTGAVQALAETSRACETKPSSYAPRPKAKDGVYGTPIGPPVVGQSRASRNHHGQKKQSAAHTKHEAGAKSAAAGKKADKAKVPK